MKKLALVTFATLAFCVSAHAESCLVADPTNTPLKYRSAPYGKVLGSLPNGTPIYINDWKYDKKGNLGCGLTVIQAIAILVGYIINI